MNAQQLRANLLAAAEHFDAAARASDDEEDCPLNAQAGLALAGELLSRSNADVPPWVKMALEVGPVATSSPACAAAYAQLLRTVAGAIAQPTINKRDWLIELERLERVALGWVDEWNAVDPFIAPREAVWRLVDTAPSDWARGLVMGIDMFRVQLEAVTGKPYAYGANAPAAI